MTDNNQNKVTTFPFQEASGNSDMPWSSVLKYIPAGFLLNRKGISLDKETPELIAGPCWIAAMTRTQKGEEWGIEVHWLDHDGKEQSFAFPIGMLYGQGSPLASELACRGLLVIPGKERRFMEYLARFELPETYRKLAVRKLGWLDCKEDQSPAFLTPGQLYGVGYEDQVIFQPHETSPTLETLHSRGTVAQWVEFVAKPCAPHPYLVFSLCSGFAGPLVKPVGLDSGGFHLYGQSSKGKTTALQLAASVWGSGADPASSEHSYICRWNTTANALEGTAAASNDLLLCLDELGTTSVKEVDTVVYNLFGGKGKQRMTKDAMLRPTRTWRTNVLSTGEISLKERLQEDRRTARTGQLIRLVDIPIEAGLIDLGQCDDPQQLVNDLKRAAGTFYGTAGETFLTELVRFAPDWRALTERIQVLHAELVEQISPSAKLDSPQQRVMQRFGTVALAGVLACKFGLLPFSKDQIVDSVRYVVHQWLQSGANLSDGERGILTLVGFISANPGRFAHTNEESFQKDLVGFRKNDSHDGFLYLFTEEGLRTALQGHHTATVLREIKARGYLAQQETGKLKSRYTVAGFEGRQSVYAIKSSIVEYGVDD